MNTHNLVVRLRCWLIAMTFQSGQIGLIGAVILGAISWAGGYGWQWFCKEFTRLYIGLSLLAGLLYADSCFLQGILVRQYRTIERLVPEDIRKRKDSASESLWFDRPTKFLWLLVVFIILLTAIKIGIIR